MRCQVGRIPRGVLASRGSKPTREDLQVRSCDFGWTLAFMQCLRERPDQPSDTNRKRSIWHRYTLLRSARTRGDRWSRLTQVVVGRNQSVGRVGDTPEMLTETHQVAAPFPQAWPSMTGCILSNRCPKPFGADRKNQKPNRKLRK